MPAIHLNGTDLSLEDLRRIVYEKVPVLLSPDAREAVEPVGRSQPTVSHHLRVLHEANLVERERRGSWVWYWVVPERLEELREALAAAGGERPRGGYPAEQRAVGQAPRRRRRQEREAEVVRQT